MVSQHCQYPGSQNVSKLSAFASAALPRTGLRVFRELTVPGGAASKRLNERLKAANSCLNYGLNLFVKFARSES